MTALTIAGFDPSSGAGITADLAVFAAHGVFGTSAVTALTVQSTMGVERCEAVDADLLEETLACLHRDLPPDGIKIGMLGGEAQVIAVANYVRSVRQSSPQVFVVLDPVVRSSSGAALLCEKGLRRLLGELLPYVDVVTPNTVELMLLTGMPCSTNDDIQKAGRHLFRRYPRLALFATGGHRDKPDDLLFSGDAATLLPGEWIATRSTHGTGCALSSALLCGVLKGQSVLNAAREAKAYVAEAMRSAVPRGNGKGPLHLLWPIAGQTAR